MAQVYAARYLARAVKGWPRDVVDSCLAKFIPIHPTVLIFNCTFVCDAECEMCGNWKRGRLKPDMTIDEIERVFASPFWRRIENVHISGGEPTTRDDLIELSRVILDRLPNLRKIGLSTTGLTPERAVPMLTHIVKLCDARNVSCSVRVAIDGIGSLHDEVRRAPKGFERACRTIRAMQALRRQYRFNIGVSTTIFSRNLAAAETILSWARSEKLDIVFNMVRFTDPMLGNRELSEACRPTGNEERRMRDFFLDRVRLDPLLDGQSYIYMHYADMIANSGHRSAPCPFQTQGLMLNPDGDLFFCENGDPVGNVREQDPGAIYFHRSSQAHRERIRRERCSTCLSPCPINVSAIKQVFPYAKFLFRASWEKRKTRASETA